jgi:hypothetical protein
MKRRTDQIVGETTEIIEPNGSDQTKVESWRLHVLMEAGYPLPLAERLAGSEADLHRAVELVGQGCAPETAVEILLERREPRASGESTLAHAAIVSLAYRRRDPFAPVLRWPSELLRGGAPLLRLTALHGGKETRLGARHMQTKHERS